MSPSPGSVPTGSYHSDRCFKISEWVAFTYGPCALQSGVFVLIFWLDESVHDLIKSRFFIPYRSMIFLDVFPIGFQSWVFWGFVPPVQDLRVGVPNVEFKSSLLKENNYTFEILSNCGLPCLMYGFSLAWPYLCFSYLSWCFTFTLCCGDSLSSFQVPLRENYSICSCAFVLLLGGGEFRIFLQHHLECLSNVFLLVW